MSATDDLRALVAQSCRVLGRLDLTNAATGHVSARIPGQDRVLIRARGPDETGVRYTTSEEIVETDFDGKLIDRSRPGLAVPNEIFIHTEIYKSRPEINAVVHIHPPMVVLFTICDRPLLPFYGAFDPPSALLAIEGIPTYQRSITITTPALGQDLVKTMDGATVCMMRGHGITAAGPSIETASLKAIQLNELALMNYRAQLLGDPSPIAAEDQAALRSRGTARPPGSAGDGAQKYVMSAWRYYCALTDS
ncbi:MAG TPA: class II aldolase/adducin family protein [Stellaceae bacterium]|nr:class II aldolase/adducin family protein [Stellaceae bacterium]